MKTSFIATVLNEEATIDRFLESIRNQTMTPDEIIITDGGSQDKTVKKINEFDRKNKVHVVLLQKKGNRSVGRNAAITKAKNDIILCSDAGCALDKDWVRNIQKPFIDKHVDVVAGYYKGISENVFQKCVIPYALVMPDKVNSETFLPATRSMAFRKKVWEGAGRFNEKLSHNEDYAFAKELEKRHAKIIFVKSAIVYWYPPTTWKKAYIMFYRFAKGDMEAGILRPKVILLFLRYVIFILLLALYFIFHFTFILYTLYFILLCYVVWAIMKNYKYVRDIQAFYFLPLLQFISDAAVLRGSISGIFFNCVIQIKSNV